MERNTAAERIPKTVFHTLGIASSVDTSIIHDQNVIMLKVPDDNQHLDEADKLDGKFLRDMVRYGFFLRGACGHNHKNVVSLTRVPTHWHCVNISGEWVGTYLCGQTISIDNMFLV
jgi:hypothetical protein